MNNVFSPHVSSEALDHYDHFLCILFIGIEMGNLILFNSTAPL